MFSCIWVAGANLIDRLRGDVGMWTRYKPPRVIFANYKVAVSIKSA